MGLPRYTRVDNGKLTVLTAEEIRPFVYQAMDRYVATLRGEYGEYLMTPEEATEASLEEHKIVLINGEYLLGYIVGSEWFSHGLLLSEEYLMRIAPGPTTLAEVFDLMDTLATLEKALGFQVGTRAATNKAAIRKLYERSGLREVMTVLRN